MSRVDPDTRTLGEPVSLGKTRRGRFDARVAPGAYRVGVLGTDGSFVETRRIFEQEESYQLFVRLWSTLDASRNMVKVPGGEARVHLPTGAARLEVHSYADFLIDPHPVTNRQFKAYLEESGRYPLESWVDWLVAQWDDPPSEDWWDFPAVYVPFNDALDYAEWYGKRLPRLVEWQAAMALAPELAENSLASVIADSNLRRPVVGNKFQDLDGYLRFVQPARRYTAGLSHGIGNVAEWAMEALQLSGGTLLWSTLGGDWESDPAKVLHSQRVGDEVVFTNLPVEWGSSAIGFRCVRSVHPSSP